MTDLPERMPPEKPPIQKGPRPRRRGAHAVPTNRRVIVQLPDDSGLLWPEEAEALYLELGRALARLPGPGRGRS